MSCCVCHVFQGRVHGDIAPCHAVFVTCFRVEYTEKSRSLQAHLRDLKSEIEVLKREDIDSTFDHLHDLQRLHGHDKYSTLRAVRGSLKF